MAQLRFESNPIGLFGATYINYVTSYNATKNQTTITFQSSTHEYIGKPGYGTNATTNITVKAADNLASTASITLFTNGTTNGGKQQFSEVPSPASITVQHGNADGVKYIQIEANSDYYFTPNGSSYNVQQHTLADGSDTVQTGTYVGGGASPITSVTKATLGGTTTVKFTPQNDTYTFELSYVDQNGTTVKKALTPKRKTEYSYSLTLPLALASLSPNAPSGNLQLSLKTLNASGKQVGTVQTRLCPYVVPDNDDTKPSQPTYIAAPEPAFFTDKYIQGMSAVRVKNMASTGKYKATIVKLGFRIENRDYANGTKSSVVSGYGSVKLYVYAIDSRGYQSKEKAVTLNVIPYSPPKLYALKGQQEIVAQRCDASGKASDSGTYLKIMATASFTDIVISESHMNILRVQFRIKAEGGTSWGGWEDLYSGHDGVHEISTEPMNLYMGATQSYNLEIKAYDSVKTEPQVVSLFIGSEKVYSHEDGAKGSFYFGGFCQKNDTFCITDGKIFEASRAEIDHLTVGKLDGMAMSNTNLLDNWYFGNPVNQRGLTTYGSNSNTIDRWKTTSGCSALKVMNGYVSAEFSTTGGAVDQYTEIPFKAGDVVTLSALMRATAGKCGVQVYTGTGYSATAYTQEVGKWEIVSITFTMEALASGTMRSFRFRSGGVGSKMDIMAIKLEMGTTQTLAHQENGEWVLNEIPNYAEQLLKCQRYYYPILADGMLIKNGFVSNANRIVFLTFDLPVKMASIPSVVYENVAMIIRMISGYSSAAPGTAPYGKPSSIAVYSVNNNSQVSLSFTFAQDVASVNNTPVSVHIRSGSIALTAEL